MKSCIVIHIDKLLQYIGYRYSEVDDDRCVLWGDVLKNDYGDSALDACCYCNGGLVGNNMFPSIVPSTFLPYSSVPSAMSSNTYYDSLKAIYEATNGNVWVSDTNWISESPLCSWYGLSCDEKERLTLMNLSNNGLEGYLPSSIGSLTHLTYLGLKRNTLYGTLPSEIGYL